MPKQETKNEQAPVVLSGTQSLKVALVKEIEASNAQIGASLSEYGRTCVTNAIGGLIQATKTAGIEFSSLDGTLLRLQLANVGYLELNYSAGEVYFDLRKQTTWLTDSSGRKVPKTTYQLAIKPQGIGNEQLTRTYGVGLKPQTGLHAPWLVREGDEFTYPQYDGLKVTPPKWVPKNPDGKVILVVYCAEKVDGSVEYLMATRESVKANVIAQIRQNMLYDKRFKKKTAKGEEYIDTSARDAWYDELNKFAESHSLEELLAEPKYAECVNPTYTSGGSKEQMIIRKMKNNALKNYPKDYKQSYIFDAVKDMYEDKDDSLDEQPAVLRRNTAIDQVENDISQPPAEENAPKDFQVTEDGEVIRNPKQEPVAEETPKEEAPEEHPEPEAEPVKEADGYDDML